MGSYELLMMIIRGTRQPANDMLPEAEQAEQAAVPVPDSLQVKATEEFAYDVADGRMPSIRVIRARLHVGQSRAQLVRAYLAMLSEG